MLQVVRTTALLACEATEPICANAHVFAGMSAL